MPRIGSSSHGESRLRMLRITRRGDRHDPKELTAFLQPYMDLMSFDVRAITQNDYASRIEELRKVAG